MELCADAYGSDSSEPPGLQSRTSSDFDSDDEAQPPSPPPSPPALSSPPPPPRPAEATTPEREASHGADASSADVDADAAAAAAAQQLKDAAQRNAFETLHELMQNAEARATLFKLLGLAETSDEPNVAVLMQMMNDPEALAAMLVMLESGLAVSASGGGAPAAPVEGGAAPAAPVDGADELPAKAFEKCRCNAVNCMRVCASEPAALDRLVALAAELSAARERKALPSAPAAAVAASQSAWCQTGGACALLSSVMSEAQQQAAALDTEPYDAVLLRVHAELLALGCCTGAADAFCAHSNAWFTRDRKRGNAGARSGSAAEKEEERWACLRPVAEVLAVSCQCKRPKGSAALEKSAIHGCTPHLSAERAELLRAEFRLADRSSTAAADLVLKWFLWDTTNGKPRHFCYDKIISLLPISRSRVSRVFDELDASGRPELVEREHGLIAFRQTPEGAPHNRMSREQEETIFAQLDAMTVALPDAKRGKTVAKTFCPGVDGKEELLVHYNDTWRAALAAAMPVVSMGAYLRVIGLWLEARGFDALYKRGGDHNLCPICEKCIVEMATLRQEIGLLGADAASAAARAEKQATHDALKAELEEHLARRTKQEQTILSIVMAAQLADVKKIMLSIIDDKAPFEEAYEKRAVGSLNKAFSRSLQAIVDDARHRTSFATTELWQGAKNAESEEHHELLHILTHHRGERIRITVRDCASLGYNASSTAALPLFLCDHKIFDLHVSLFWFENHGKCICDTEFGHADSCLLAQSGIYSADTMMAALSSLKSSGSGSPGVPVECEIHNPAAFDAWNVMLGAQFNSKTTPTGEEVPVFDASVELKKRMPHAIVVYGAHIETEAQVDELLSVIPDEEHRSWLKSFHPSQKQLPKGGGWVAMQSFYGEEIWFTQMYKEDAKYKPPPARHRQASDAEAFDKQFKPLSSAITKVLKEKDDEHPSKGTKIERLTRLLALGGDAAERVLVVSEEEKAAKAANSSGAASSSAPEAAPAAAESSAAASADAGASSSTAAAPTRTLRSATAAAAAAAAAPPPPPAEAPPAATPAPAASSSVRTAVVAVRQAVASNVANTANATNTARAAAAAVVAGRRCRRCKAVDVPAHVAVCATCRPLVRATQSVTKVNTNGAVKPSYHSWQLSAANPENLLSGARLPLPATAALKAQLYPDGYTDSLRYFHRRNWISRGVYEVAIWPSEFFVNAQDQLPLFIERHAADIRPLGPGGVLHIPKDGEFALANLEFKEAIQALESKFDSNESYVRLSDLLTEVCKLEGLVPIETVRSLSAEAKAKRDEIYKEYKERVKREKAEAEAKAKAEAALRVLVEAAPTLAPELEARERAMLGATCKTLHDAIGPVEAPPPPAPPT